MKLINSLFLTVIASAFVACTEPIEASKSETNMTTDNTQSTSDFHGFSIKSLDGKEIDFSQFKGKKVLLVNTASACGYTPQYAGLQELHEKHSDKVVVLGFPANNFGGQEPGSHEDIAAFCEKNYGVSFPLSEKISVAGDDTHPIYQWLAQNAPNQEKPDWNFCKYLVNENGEVVAFFPSKAEPMGEEIVMAIQE